MAFHRTSFRYFYRKYFGILCIALYVCGIFQRIFPQNVLPGRYQTADASDRGQRFSCSLIIYFLLFLFRGKFDILYYLLNIMIPELVYTMVVTIFLYIL